MNLQNTPQSLELKKTNDAILLLDMDMDSGHGGARGRYASIMNTAFIYSFILKNINEN